MSYVEEDKMYSSVVTQIDKDPFIHTKKWMKGFSILSIAERTEIIKMIHDLQKDNIIVGMEQLDDNITIPSLGRFVLNKGRKEYVELMKEDNNLSHEEIQKIVVENFITRHKQNKQKKLWKNKG